MFDYGTYCNRCDRDFSNEFAMIQHLRYSTWHYICEVCNYDGSSWGDIFQHHRETAHRHVCEGCENGDGKTWQLELEDDFLAHFAEENVCRICDRHFQSSDNLFHHNITHLAPSEECYGCDRWFKKYAYMVLHLESGSCPSGLDAIDLNNTAARCFQWAKFVDVDVRKEMLADRSLTNVFDKPIHAFHCPTCDAGFSRLSGLFQHVESRSCDQGLYDYPMSKLVKWLANRHA